MKTTLVVSVLVCLTGCVSVDAGQFDPKDGRHSISMGQRRGNAYSYLDSLLFHDNPHIAGSWFRVQSYDVCYPSAGSPIPASQLTITAFNVTDVVPGGEGGYAFVTDGGVNSAKLCLHLKSQRGNGYNFIIDIWGYYNN